MRIQLAVPWVMDVIFIAGNALVSDRLADKSKIFIHIKRHSNGQHFRCKS